MGRLTGVTGEERREPGPCAGVGGCGGEEERGRVCNGGCRAKGPDSVSPASPAGERTGNSLMVLKRGLM